MKSLLTKSVPIKNWYLFTGTVVSLVAQSIFAISIMLSIKNYGYEVVNLMNIIAILLIVNIVALVVSSRSEPMNKLRFKNVQSSQFIISLLVVILIAIYTKELITNLYIAILVPSLFFMMIAIILEGIEVTDE